MRTSFLVQILRELLVISAFAKPHLLYFLFLTIARVEAVLD